MRDKPLVSIIVPVYMVEPYVSKCAESLFSQSYNRIEFIFVDDCSKDNSVDIVRHLQVSMGIPSERVILISNQMNKGVSYCRNVGMEKACGEYVLFVDSDDYIDTDAVERLVETAEKENADLVVSDFYLDFKGKNIRQSSIYPDLNSPDYLYGLIKRKYPLGVCGKFFRRSIFTDNNICHPVGIAYGEDMITTIKFVYHAKKIVMSDFPFYHYVQGNPTSACKKIPGNYIEGIMVLEREFYNYFVNRLDVSVLNACLSVYRQKMRSELLFNTTKVIRREYRDLFKENKCDYRLLPLRERPFMWLWNHNLISLAELYISTYRIAFKLKKKLLG